MIFGDTGQAPYGMDTYGSRSLAVGGVAIVHAAEAVVAKARVIAGHLLEVSPDDLEFVDGSFRVKGDPDSTKTIQAVAWEAFTSHDLPDGTDPTLFGDSTVDPQVFSFPHGTHLCAVEVDTETGMTKIRTYVAVDDVGVQINPMIVEGQIHGGITQGIAQALWEGAAYDEDGNLPTASLADYLLPTAADVPFYDHRTHRHPVHHPPAGHQGRRRGRHHRLHPGGDQRRHRRAAAARRHGRAECRPPRRPSGGAIQAAAGPGSALDRRPRRRPRPVNGGAAMIPAAFDYVTADVGRRRRQRADRRRRRRQGDHRRAVAAAAAADPAGGRRPCWSTAAGSRRCAECPTPVTHWSSVPPPPTTRSCTIRW